MPMSTYEAPLKDMQFVICELAGLEPFCQRSSDTAQSSRRSSRCDLEGRQCDYGARVSGSVSELYRYWLEPPRIRTGIWGPGDPWPSWRRGTRNVEIGQPGLFCLLSAHS